MSIEEVIAKMVVDDGNHTPLTLEKAAAYIRQAYGVGYTDALEAEQPDLEAAHEAEREAWAHLPV